MSTVENGSKVTVHYVGTFTDGTKFDSSRDRGEELAFEVGSGNMIKGFNDACIGMTVGDTKAVTLEPQDAYGDVDPNAIGAIPLQQFPDGFKPVPGATVIGQNELGQKMMATIKSYGEDSVELDFNHPLAGKTLNFEIELLTIG